MDEDYLASQHLVTWSADVVADDWFRGISAQQIAKRAIRRLDEKGRGILLLHDIHPATAMALPTILKELKERGYHVVQVVPAGERPASVPMLAASPDKGAWPRVLKASADDDIVMRKPVHHHRIKRAVTRKRHRAAFASAREPNHAGYRDWQVNQF